MMPPPAPPPLLLLSGISGAGKSIALKTLEDSGYYCIDNLPVELLADCLQTLKASESGLPGLIAVAIDVRSRSDLADMPGWLAALGREGHDPQLVFIDCDDESLLRRYADTRRRHPLSHLGLALGDAIALERQVLRPLSSLADVHIDSSALNVHQLRRIIIERLGVGHDQPPAVLLQSFAYKRGLPADADFVFDARVLPNPHWNPELRPLSGRDMAVRAYFDAEPEMQLYLAQVCEFLDTWLPRLREATRSYITIAFGCTGGRHRSVYLAESIASHLRERGWPDSATYHREQA